MNEINKNCTENDYDRICNESSSDEEIISTPKKYNKLLDPPLPEIILYLITILVALALCVYFNPLGF